MRQQCSRSSFRRLSQLLSVADNEECVALFQELLAPTGLSNVIGNWRLKEPEANGFGMIRSIRTNRRGEWVHHYEYD